MSLLCLMTVFVLCLIAVIERTKGIEKWAIEIDPRQCQWMAQLE